MPLISKSLNQGTRVKLDIMFCLPHRVRKSQVCIEADLNDMYACMVSTLADVSPEFNEFAREVLEGTEISSHVMMKLIL